MSLLTARRLYIILSLFVRLFHLLHVAATIRPVLLDMITNPSSRPRDDRLDTSIGRSKPTLRLDRPTNKSRLTELLSSNHPPNKLNWPLFDRPTNQTYHSTHDIYIHTSIGYDAAKVENETSQHGTDAHLGRVRRIREILKLGSIDNRLTALVPLVQPSTADHHQLFQALHKYYN